MTKQQLIDYLRIVLQVEGELDTLRETKSQYERTIKSLGKPVSICVDEQLILEEKRKEPRKISFYEEALGPLSFLAIVSAFFYLVKFAENSAEKYDNALYMVLDCSLFMITPPIILLLIVLLVIRLINSRKKASYKHCVQEVIEQAQEQYQNALKLDAKRIQDEKKIAVHIESASLSPTIELISFLEKELQNLYDLNIIYPTYRNIIAVAQILEYLESGICEKLEGTDGAYAQYMLDVRTERIVGSVNELREAVVAKLDKIIANQNLMCRLLQENNRVLQSIERTVGLISTQLNDIHSTLNSMHDTQLTATQYLSDTNKQLTRIANSYDRTAVEAAAIGANQRTQMIRDGISQYRIKYPA